MPVDSWPLAYPCLSKETSPYNLSDALMDGILQATNRTTVVPVKTEEQEENEEELVWHTEGLARFHCNVVILPILIPSLAYLVLTVDRNKTHSNRSNNKTVLRLT